MTDSIKYILLLPVLCSAALSASAQNQGEKSPEEMAAAMVTKMEDHLNLEPHQAFFVDSIFCHDYTLWMDEIHKMREAGVQEITVYQQIKTKWDAHMDSALVRVLTPEQFTEYQKMVGRYKKPKKEKKR